MSVELLLLSQGDRSVLEGNHVETFEPKIVSGPLPKEQL